MAPRQVESVYRIVDVVGESATSWEEAGRHAVETASTSIRDLRVAEVVKMERSKTERSRHFGLGLPCRSSTKRPDVRQRYSSGRSRPRTWPHRTGSRYPLAFLEWARLREFIVREFIAEPNIPLTNLRGPSRK